MKKLWMLIFILPYFLLSNADADMFTVNSNGALVNSQSLDVGVEYIIEVSGTYVFGDFTAYADAEYYMNSSGRNWNEVSENYPTDSSRLDLLINGQDQDWLGTTDGTNFADGVFSPTHIYRLFWIGTGDMLQFQIYDTIYADNFGSLQVEVSQAPVPEPATIFLIGTGLIGLAGFGRKKIKQ